MTATSVRIAPTDDGWAVSRSDGYEVIRYSGLFSKGLAARYLKRYAEAHSQAHRFATSDRPR